MIWFVRRVLLADHPFVHATYMSCQVPAWAWVRTIPEGAQFDAGYIASSTRSAAGYITTIVVVVNKGILLVALLGLIDNEAMKS